MKAKKIVKVTGVIGIFGLASIVPVLAQTQSSCPSWLPSQMCGAGGKVLDLHSIVRLVLYILIVAAVLWSLWNVIQAGLQFSGAGEDAEKKKKATQKIIAAVVGLIIVVVSFTILSLIGRWVGPSVEYFGTPCVVDDEPDGAPDTSTKYGILLQVTANQNFGCRGAKPGSYVCVNPQPEKNDFSKAAIDCSVE